MPDLVTHTASAYFFMRSRRFRTVRLFFYIGVLLPDLLSRPFHILNPKWQPFTLAVHTPVFMFVFCLLFAELFSPPLRREVRLYTFAGSLLHFGLDLLQRHIGSGYFWLYPFSWNSFEWGLFGPEASVSFVPLWIIIILISEWVIRRQSRF